ncbi:MAG: methyltransferase domain-containing protein [Bacteroidetes bacterium]|nr:methyltransferase domain-containing protein [Bacteroidota bacterium]
MQKSDAWFEEWFDSPFYHILYGHRDDMEARRFIGNLIDNLAPEKQSRFLDLACGKGRHSRVIRDLGFEVDGIDLSQNSIEEAKVYEHEGLHFAVHDMREVYRENHYHYVFNLFTSFGYFCEFSDHEKTLNAIYKQLVDGGVLVIDYLNFSWIQKKLANGFNDVIHRQGIDFHIQKTLDKECISKSIDFRINNKNFHFEEHVWRLHLADFYQLLTGSGFEIQTIFGDYELKPFKEDESERLIIIATK